ncbi:unnamed protein product [Rangifer tarandus platyrhynchus]|uniref:Uncharacterized protein n=1 Tax=Rangifer tarandus platyrhynchus TaxID=3082113 RepID=A0AC59ZZ82_RANTA
MRKGECGAVAPDSKGDRSGQGQKKPIWGVFSPAWPRGLTAYVVVVGETSPPRRVVFLAGALCGPEAGRPGLWRDHQKGAAAPEYLVEEQMRPGAPGDGCGLDAGPVTGHPPHQPPLRHGDACAWRVPEIPWETDAASGVPEAL